MVNKKGILRILEASMAILIIFAVLLSFAATNNVKNERDLSQMINPLLEELAKNSTIRDQIISNSDIANETILKFLASRIKESNIGYDLRICELDEVCGMKSYPSGIIGNVYAGSRTISSNLIVGSQPKRVNLFLWIK